MSKEASEEYKAIRKRASEYVNLKKEFKADICIPKLCQLLKEAGLEGYEVPYKIHFDMVDVWSRTTINEYMLF